MVILQRIYRNFLTVILPCFGLQYSTVGELWVMVISQYMPVCYKFCYFCIHINPHQFKNNVWASKIPSPRLPHSFRQPVNIQKSYNKHTAQLFCILLLSCLLALRVVQ